MVLTAKDKEAYRTLEEHAEECDLKLTTAMDLIYHQKDTIDRLRDEIVYTLKHISHENMTSYRVLVLTNHLKRALEHVPRGTYNKSV